MYNMYTCTLNDKQCGKFVLYAYVTVILFLYERYIHCILYIQKKTLRQQRTKTQKKTNNKKRWREFVLFFLYFFRTSYSQKSIWKYVCVYMCVCVDFCYTYTEYVRTHIHTQHPTIHKRGVNRLSVRKSSQLQSRNRAARKLSTGL